MGTATEPERETPESEGRSRRPVRSLLRRHRFLVAVLAVVGLAGVAFVLVWFQPHKYFLNTTVRETAPSPAQVRVLARGGFRSLEHGTSGRALVLELADGSRVLRFEELDTSNGPDLHVYLSEVPASDHARAYGERFVDLGKLNGNKGSQNYAIPPETDLSRYRSAVVWCKRFAVGFGVAPLDRQG